MYCHVLSCPFMYCHVLIPHILLSAVLNGDSEHVAVINGHLVDGGDEMLHGSSKGGEGRQLASNQLTKIRGLLGMQRIWCRTQWARITKNPDCSTGPLACPFARSLAPLHSLLRFLLPACFTRALRCAHLFACSLTLLTPSLVGQSMILWLFFLCFFLFWIIVQWRKLH